MVTSIERRAQLKTEIAAKLKVAMQADGDRHRQVSELRDLYAQLGTVTNKVQLEDDHKIDNLQVHRDKATAELRAKIAELEKPFDAQIHALHEHINSINEDTREHNYEAPVNGVILKYAENNGQLDLPDEVKAFCMRYGLYGGGSDITPIKQRLKNGLYLVRLKDYSEVSYFAMRGMELMGVHHTRRAAHPGDYPDYKGLVGAMYAKVMKEHWGRTTEQDPTFREWKVLVENLDPKADAIDLTDKKNIELVNSVM